VNRALLTVARVVLQALRNAGLVLSEAEYDQLMDIFDADHSGDIDYVEVCVCV